MSAQSDAALPAPGGAAPLSVIGVRLVSAVCAAWEASGARLMGEGVNPCYNRRRRKL